MDQVIESLESKNIKMNKSDILRTIFNLFNEMLISDDRDIRVKAFDWDELVRIFLKKYDIKWSNKIEKFYHGPHLKQYVSLYSDAKSNLKWLIENGYRLSLISNGLSTYQNKVIEVLGISDFFENIILPDHVNVNDIKPSEKIFNYALSIYKKVGNNESNTCLYVGDSIYFDILGANSSNLESVLLSRRLSRKMKKLSIEERTKKFNEEEFLLKYIKRDILISRFDLNKDIDFDLLRPKKVICSLDELKEILNNS
jgi:FMN phosphatase YigB (HAD superfamily)